MFCAEIQEVVSRISNLPDVQYVYHSQVEIKGERKPLLLILLSEGGSGLPDDLVPLMYRLFREHTGFLFRTYALAFAERQLRLGNLFFIRTCGHANLVYSLPGLHLLPLTEGMDMDRALEVAKGRFQREYTKAVDFKEGALFYVGRGNYAQAAFMLHQAIELAYRLAEMLAIGKEKICHSIAAHQKYINPFIPELGTLFNTEKETIVLQRLDDAYKGVRYGMDYRVSPEQVQRIYAKSEIQLTIVHQLFHTGWEACKTET